MQQWEYLEAYVHADVWHDSTGRTETLEQVRVPVRGVTGQYASTAPVLNALGQQGWELAGVAVLETPYPTQRLYLKRPKQSSQG